MDETKGDSGIKNESPLPRRAAHYCQPMADDCFRKQIKERHGIELGRWVAGGCERKTDELINF